jgi:indole-3-glycerol phosphate synthase
LKEALENSASGIIAEFKRKSPSKGWIHPDAEAAVVCSAYESSGASGISVLTDEDFFGGTTQDLSLVREGVQLPLLRKDFILDEYQLYQSKALGADLILLIAAALTPARTRSLAAKARQLGLEVLLEIHSLNELDHINEHIDILGVNNRRLQSFETDLQLSFELAGYLPEQVLKISESGLSAPADVLALRQAGYKGFLMGEAFMKTADPGKALSDFIKQLS